MRQILLILLTASLLACASGDSPFVGSGGDSAGSGDGGGGGGGGGSSSGPNDLSNVVIKTGITTAQTSNHIRNVLQSDDGNIIVFSAQMDTGSNPDNIEQIFTIIGSAVSQISSFTLANPGMKAASSGLPYTELVLSADGSQIAWAGTQDPLGTNGAANVSIFTMASDGTGLTQLATASAGGTITNAPPAVATDGSSIYFASTGDHAGANGGNDLQIFSINADGSGVAQETSNGGTGTGIGWIDVSPTGLLAFTGQGDWLNDASNADGNAEIYTIQSNGSGGTGLAIHTNTAGANDTGKIFISNDSNIVVFRSDRDPTGSNADNSVELFSVNIGSATVTQLTTDWRPAFYTGPGWPFDGSDMFSMSGDGSRIVYCDTLPATGAYTTTNYQARIMSVNADASNISTIIETEADTLALTDYISYPSANLTGNITAFYSNINFQKTDDTESDMQIYTASQ